MLSISSMIIKYNLLAERNGIKYTLSTNHWQIYFDSWSKNDKNLLRKNEETQTLLEILKYLS